MYPNPSQVCASLGRHARHAAVQRAGCAALATLAVSEPGGAALALTLTPTPTPTLTLTLTLALVAPEQVSHPKPG